MAAARSRLGKPAARAYEPAMTGTDTPPPAGEARRRRSAARLAAAQALYQRAMGGTPTARLLAEFHDHRLGREVEPDGELLADADRAFFDDLVTGVLARTAEIDTAIGERLARGWTIDRLDRLMLQILRCGAYELIARPDIPAAAVVSEYVDVADAFFPRTEVGFVNALLDRMARTVRPAAG
jgi:N utilization substance protein B